MSVKDCMDAKTTDVCLCQDFHKVEKRSGRARDPWRGHPQLGLFRLFWSSEASTAMRLDSRALIIWRMACRFKTL